MKKFKIMILGAFLLMGLILINGFNQEDKTQASNVIALLNGHAITIEDVEKLIDLTEVELMLSASIQGDAENFELDEDFFERLIQEAQTEDQKRYYERKKRANDTRYNKNKNDVFNIIIREVVLSQEAKEQGYKATIEEARTLRNQMDDYTRMALEENGNAEDLKRFDEFEAAAAEMLGYTSREAWFEASLVDTVYTIEKSEMKNKFYDYMMKKHPSVQGDEWMAIRSNALEAYTEYLLMNSKLKMYNNGFKIVYYEAPWTFGPVDLKNK